MRSFIFGLILLISLPFASTKVEAQKFQGQAMYYSKSKMQLGSWGARLSEGQKKQIAARLKNRLEKNYVLTFNMQESMFLEKQKIDAISGATDSWGGYFSRGDQYKNIKDNQLIQSQEFYGKRFLVKDKLYKIDWQIGTESKKIGNYESFKATASVPKSAIAWYNFSWSDLRNNNNNKEGEEKKEPMIQVEAWYTPQIPVAQGPGEFWGLPGLILEVSAGNTTLLCSEIILNPADKLKIKAPTKGQEITIADYTTTIQTKMADMRNNRMGRRPRRSR